MALHRYHDIFDTTHLQSDLNRRSVRSGAVTLVSQGLLFVLQLGSTMILARILSPSDYGINAMAVAITGFANIFGYFGLSTATIQRSEISHEQVSTLFWINAGIGVSLNLVIAAISPLVSWFYKTPEMLWVMLSLSIIFSINGISIQHNALLKRQMRFYAIAKIQVLSMLAGIVVAVIAGMHGFGYWALVLNTLTNVTCNTIGSWLACRWIPGLPTRSTEVLSMIKFGTDLAAYNVISYFARNLDNVLIGRYHGSGPLGLYSKAYQLLMMPINNLEVPMSSIAMPALSRLQGEPEQFRTYYRQYLSLLAFFSMPLVVFLFVCSDLLIHILLGPQWNEASGLFKILATVAFLQPMFSTYSLVLISLGQSRRYFKFGSIYSFFISMSFFAGLPWGAAGVATSYATAFYLLFLPMFYFSFKETPISINLFMASVWRPLLASLLMGVGAQRLLQTIGNMNELVLLLVISVASAMFYLLSFLVVPGGLKRVNEYVRYIREMVRNRS